MATLKRWVICSHSYWAANPQIHNQYIAYFQSLTTWGGSGLNKDLVAQDANVIVDICFDDANLPRVNSLVGGWTTDVTHGILIRATVGQETRGQPHTSPAATNQGIIGGIIVNDDYVFLRDLRVYPVNADAIVLNGRNALVDRCYVYQGYQSKYGILSKSNVKNCVVLSDANDRSGIQLHETAQETRYIDNCTVKTSEVSYFINSSCFDVKIRNCVAIEASSTLNAEFYGHTAQGTNWELQACASPSGATTPRIGVVPHDVVHSDFSDVANTNYSLSHDSPLAYVGIKGVADVDVNLVKRL